MKYIYIPLFKYLIVTPIILFNKPKELEFTENIYGCSVQITFKQWLKRPMHL